MKFILSFDNNSLVFEIGKFFSYKEFLTTSFFVQQRQKLSCEAFEQLFHYFTQQTDVAPQFKEYKYLSRKKDLKEIYRLRWGIETGFRFLKYVIGLIAFHSKQENSILQEVLAKLILHNFSMLIAGKAKISQKKNPSISVDMFGLNPRAQ